MYIYKFTKCSGTFQEITKEIFYLMKCSGKFYGMQVSMTQQSGDFEKIIFTIVTHNRRQNI